MEHNFLMLLVSVGSSLAVGVLAAYITFRLQFEKFKATAIAWEQHWKEWRDKFDQSITDLTTRVGTIERTSISEGAFNTLRTDSQLSARRFEEMMDRHADEAKKDRHAINNVLSQLMVRMAVQEEVSKDGSKPKR